MLKTRLKRSIGKAAQVDFLEKLTEYAIAEQVDAVSLKQAETVIAPGTTWEHIIERGREDLWRRSLARIGSEDLLLLEFGVFQGESIRYLADYNRSQRSLFYGFDSFEGLPEGWRGNDAGHFSVGGEPPKIDDPRVRFVKGWFRDTLPPLMDELVDAARDRALLVHFDADLYSSTLYLLFTLGIRFKRYHFIFDEFSGHETRALYNYIQATGAEARFFYRLDWEGYPQVVSGELTLP